ncbi:MAG: T9SS type A sorting domain-containing protein [Cytophagaceae bacterium]|jgi:ELWxxDGT repeat protein|nr:T9SS type A sorting domain-containing protein [Cytophagaceae bacterium]
MKKSTFLIAVALLLATGGAMAQLDPNAGGTLVSLMPAGVKPVITGDRKGDSQKNLVIAGNESKGYKAFFAATDAEHGEELWVTDGTSAGTHMVKDINPGAVSSDVAWMKRFNDKVVFAANDGSAGNELWISDGTEEGTSMVKDIHDSGSSDPQAFYQVNEEKFIFRAMDYDSESTYDTPQWWLWVSDGTSDGTEMIYECDTRFPGNDNYIWYPQTYWCRVEREVYFKADYADKSEGGTGEELWVTDGTTAGTRLVKDINTEEETDGVLGTRSSNVGRMINFENKKVVFRATTVEHGGEPWASDGTEAGTYEIYNNRTGLNAEGREDGSEFGDVGYYKGHIYSRTSRDPNNDHELGKTNTQQGNFDYFQVNRNVFDPNATNDHNAFPDWGVVFDGVYMFCAQSGPKAALFDPETGFNCGGELHYTDGNTVTMQSNFGPTTQSNWVKELTVVSGSLYWWNEAGNPIENRTKLIRINNKEQFPQRVTNISPDGDNVHTLRNLGGKLLFVTGAITADVVNLYCYEYRKENYNPETDKDDLEINYEPFGTDNIVTNTFAKNIAIYPNPAADNFSFAVEGKVTGVKIFDMSGRLAKADAEPVNNTVNVNTLTKGIYNVVITTNNGNYMSKLVVE